MTPPPIPAEVRDVLFEALASAWTEGRCSDNRGWTAECSMEYADSNVDALLSAIARAIAGGRGEPKGWLCTKPQLADVIVRTRDRADEWADYGYAITPLYAQPAPEKVDG